jgi:hypothetical protein
MEPDPLCFVLCLLCYLNLKGIQMDICWLRFVLAFKAVLTHSLPLTQEPLNTLPL